MKETLVLASRWSKLSIYCDASQVAVHNIQCLAWVLSILNPDRPWKGKADGSWDDSSSDTRQKAQGIKTHCSIFRNIVVEPSVLVQISIQLSSLADVPELTRCGRNGETDCIQQDGTGMREASI